MTRACALLCALLLVGCATIPPEDEALLSREIDCERAEETIEAIREARPTDIDRARVLALSLSPAGLAYGAVTGDLNQRNRLLSGDYDNQLRDRIRQVATACDIPVPELEEPETPPS